MQSCSFLGIRARQHRITTIDVWEPFARDSLIVCYHDGLDDKAHYTSPNARHYTIEEWSRKPDDPNDRTYVRNRSAFVTLLS
jgi:hypothetical protein